MTTPLSKIPNFRPEAMPVLGIDSHLPAVPAARLTGQALRERFAETGRAWEPEIMREHRFVDRQPAQAAVLVPIVQRAQPTVLLTVRTAHLSSHSGQIAFPGGKTDDTDPDAAFTALREADEEVGLKPAFAEVIGTLPTYVTGTAFVITPVIALVRPGFELQPNEFEVADAFEVPLSFLMDPANHHRHAIEFEGVRREWFSMPFDDGGRKRFIWGATAGMLRNLYRYLSA
ncbi:MAG: CoA pyrophosphatase [Burkholderiales bacterium]|jgi:8-oxo-dGTP pyrophosphatase MutT (NUDIX family)|nr:CoA pyrophosphatase [Burkholderiales bacterium]